MIFPCDLKYISEIGYSKTEVSKLPQLYRCDMDFANSLNNVALSQILMQIPKHPEYKYCSIDSRSHMLMKDMYPCIPGWHCDDFYRDDKESQPKLDTVAQEAPALHYVVLIGDNSKTEFLAEHMNLPSPEELRIKHPNEPYYLIYDKMLDVLKPQTVFLEPNKLYSFGPLCFHRGTGATHNGWRYFMRITFSNHREPKNELRYQTQVYTMGRVSW